ncbi:MAG: hypothetical protein K0S65_5887, partial [Labilithrix sp.]|nr:hypothetical protein [Labilithrix sp.]
MAGAARRRSTRSALGPAREPRVALSRRRHSTLAGHLAIALLHRTSVVGLLACARIVGLGRRAPVGSSRSTTRRSERLSLRTNGIGQSPSSRE